MKLKRFAWLSIAAALLTIALKGTAYVLTGSVGLLSDALESLVNLVAAVVALIALTVAAAPPDDLHAYGHSKAEYFSSGFEGALILLAAASIAWTAVPRLITPQPLEQVWIGLAMSALAAAVNLGVGWILLHAGRTHGSITLEANAHHLMTDVWTSAGVILGVAAVAVTGWEILDPVIALVVAANILWTGVKLLRRSAMGLLDTAIPVSEQETIMQVLEEYSMHGMQYHALRTRQAGARKFISVHLLVPGHWTVHRGHQLAAQVEADIQAALPGVYVFTHLEPLDSLTVWDDRELEFSAHEK